MAGAFFIYKIMDCHTVNFYYIIDKDSSLERQQSEDYMFNKICALIYIMAIATVARADYHYASHTGSNTPPYSSWATAADSIQHAIDASSPHDTVYISAGNWYESDTTGMYDSVAIIGAGMDSTFWYTNDNSLAILIIDYNCSVKGISFINSGTGACIYVNFYASANISECWFRGHYGVAMGGGSYSVTNCVFDSCNRTIDGATGHYVIKNNLLTKTYDNGGGYAINIIENSALIENNIIINDTRPSRYPDGIIAYDSPNVVIRNNIIINAVSGVSAFPYLKINNTLRNFIIAGFDNVRTGDSLINNSITNSPRLGVFVSRTYVAYNNYWGLNSPPYAGIQPETIGNINQNPMYVSSSDFHLQMYSPLIDVGDPNRLDKDSTRSDIGVYGGPYGQSYDYLDLPPAIPDSLHGQYVEDTIYVDWAYNTEADFSNYFIFRDTISGFAPSGNNLIATPESSYFIDINVRSNRDYYYRVSAADNHYNFSGYSPELPVFTSDIWPNDGAQLPRMTAIQTNYPNPFNATTTIVYQVADLGPIPAQINIYIYDITGRQVKDLVNQRKEVGVHRVTWEGRNEAGEMCPSGVYFAKISQWDISLSGKPRKLVLLK
jgi:hypothetical protein